MARLKFRPASPSIKVDEYGTVKYYNEKGQLHREDGPAVIHTNGYEEWYQNNKLHRLDGPALTYIDGTKEWHLNGFLHRLDGPAIERTDGRKEWWVNGELVGKSLEGFTAKDFERWKKKYRL